jgi:NAD dependent epimerase/dehydratase family enzyme
LLASQRVVPELALAAGFRFQFPDFRSAVEDLVA